jgi:hypothetical protein
MQIVKFKNGKYALRRWTIFGFEYLSRYTNDCWWGIGRAQDRCVGTFEQIQELKDNISDFGKPVCSRCGKKCSAH